MQDTYRLCYPAVTPHILTGNQTNRVWVSGGPEERESGGVCGGRPCTRAQIQTGPDEASESREVEGLLRGQQGAVEAR